MRVIEFIKKQERDLKSTEVVKNLILELNLSNEQAARIAEVSVDFVRKVRMELSKKD